MNKELIALLAVIADGKYHSGARLADRLGITRAALCKMIKQLQNRQLPLVAVPGKGYRVTHDLELLSEDNIKKALPEKTSKLCRHLEILFDISSTNSYLFNRLTKADLHGHVVFAEMQSCGRGRRGNKWYSPLAGGLYMSVAWHFENSSAAAGPLALFMGVAVARSLQTLGLNDIGLKWPNDILLKDKKVGGVLLDLCGEVHGPTDVVIGVGINYTIHGEPPAWVDREITDIVSHANTHLSKNTVAAALLSQVLDVLDYIGTDNADGLMEAWRQFDHIKGKAVSLGYDNNNINGIAEGVDDGGRLLINVDGNIQRHAAGELRLRLQK